MYEDRMKLVNIS